MKTIRILQVGLGPLGLKMTRYIAERNGLETVAAVDIDSSKTGRKLSELAGSKGCDVTVQSRIEMALQDIDADIALLTTVSDMIRIKSQVLDIMSHGLPVVSTCEELFYPWDESPEIAGEIDKAARKAGVAVLATGVNPGFLMDALPAFLTSVCQRVNSIEVKRYQNAAFRRLPFQRKIGAGLTLEKFEERKRDGSLRHVGLTESMQFMANRMGWKLTRTEDIISPVVAKELIKTDQICIEPGMTSGVRQVGNGFIGKEKKLSLIFQAAVGEPRSCDEVLIRGVPDVRSVIEGGVNGDIATCAIALNAMPRVLEAKPGLRTMGEVGILSYWGGGLDALKGNS